jgi:hypothetical protein
VVLGLELRAYTLSHSTSPFLWTCFQDRVSQTIFLAGWLRAAVLLISASWVAKMTGMSHRCPAQTTFLKQQSLKWKTDSGWEELHRSGERRV